jgi:uncharacterized protein YggU (UPF0235/DUF167 family)
LSKGGGEKASSPWVAESGGVALYVRLTPKGGRDALDGVESLADGRSVLKARVRAAPENGRANEALIALIAAALRVPKSAVTIRAGATSRVKTVFIAGAPAAYLDALARLAPTSG